MRKEKTQMLMTIHSSHRMSLIRSSVLLLLCAIVTLTNAQSVCLGLGDATKTSTNYTLTAPTSVTNDTVYQVNFTTTSSTSGSVHIQVLSSNTPVGTWSLKPTGFEDCSGGGIWGNFTASSTSFIANWTSPATLNATSVIFKASINDTYGTFVANQTASFAITNTTNTMTTAATVTTATTANTTNTMTTATTANATNTATTATTANTTNTMTTATTATTANTTNTATSVNTANTATTANTTNTANTANTATSVNTATIANTTATTKIAATSGGPANHPASMFFTLVETLFFLVITGKFLL